MRQIFFIFLDKTSFIRAGIAQLVEQLICNQKVEGSTPSVGTSVPRIPLVDGIKAIACLLIVLHHLAIYGPMSDSAYPLMPNIMDWLREYPRMAVQVFFIATGFLLASKLIASGSSFVINPIQAIKKRYFRLIIPYLAALTMALWCAALARYWMTHDSIPSAPNGYQLLAHIFLLQDLLNQEALSAGVWYVAIDFQLFSLTIFLFWLSDRIQQYCPYLKSLFWVLVIGLVIISLFVFNRDNFWDETALYFFGSYGLGILSYWVSNKKRPLLWFAILSALGVIALLVDFRARVVVAIVVMLLLGLTRRYGILSDHLIPNFLIYLGRASYAIFLIHFPLCLIVNAVFSHFFPDQAQINLCGLFLALGISIFGGILFYRWTDGRSLTNKIRPLIPTGFMVSGLLAALGSY